MFSSFSYVSASYLKCASAIIEIDKSDFCTDKCNSTLYSLLEPLAAGEACKKITEEQIHELEEIHKEYVPIVEADEIDAKKLYLQNRKFHFAIYSISEMDRVCAMIESLWDTLSFFKLIYGRDVIKNTNGAKNMIAEHQGYIDALKDRDAERLKKSLYDTLGVRIEGISKETDYYTL